MVVIMVKNLIGGLTVEHKEGSQLIYHNEICRNIDTNNICIYQRQYVASITNDTSITIIKRTEVDIIGAQHNMLKHLEL